MKSYIYDELELLKRGTVEIITEEELVNKIEISNKENKKLNIKAGFDPSAPDLHLGHTVVLQKMKHFQDLGHNVLFLIGDFTGMIGDPTGRSETRKALTSEEVKKNAETYKEQVFKILDPDKTKIVFNSSWMSKMSVEKFIELTKLYTVARMLERDDFSNRFKNNIPIGIHEFLYPLIQAYDSVVLKADIELGGTDQKFNLIVGRDIQRRYNIEPQVAMTMPILVGLDGVQKMSKSLNNYIALKDAPEEMFGKIMSISDELMIRYYVLLSDKPISDIDKVKNGKIHPMDAKKDLAFELVNKFHSYSAAKKALEQFERVFTNREIPKDIEEFVFSDNIDIISMLKNIGFASSKSEAKRLVIQGGVYIDNSRINDINYKLSKGEYIIKVGKRKFAKIKIVGAKG
ncbi:MAG: tyrosine--tRNA ligase [Deferribacterota bacterium]|nr:tyrosine--tRNA ligase [Deferribacterota bacterium]